MGFSSEFKAIADDPNGEALAVRAYLRADTAGGADQLITLTGLEEVLAVSEVKRYREREFGIVQGQQWELQLANVYDTFNPNSDAWPSTESSMLLKWVAMQIGFPVADEWETVAQGRIHRGQVDTNGRAMIQAGDPIMDLLTYAWPRDAVFDERDAWVSPVQCVLRAPTSKPYLAITGPVIVASPISDVHNETFRLIFASPTTYNVVYEDGTSQAGGPYGIVGAPVVIVSNQSAGSVVSMAASDWSNAPGAYATGDEFVLHTSKEYTAADLQPVALIQELITQAGRDQSYNVIAGTSQDVWFDSAHWDDVDDAFPTTLCRGYWAKGSNLMEMIQGLLKAMNATIYPSTDGRIAIWHLEPGGVGDTGVEISGEPNANPISIAYAHRLSDHEDIVNSSTWNYGHLDFTAGDDGQVPAIQPLVMAKDDLTNTTFVDPVTGEPVVRHKDITIGWAIDSVTIDAASNRHLNRFETDVPTYLIRGSLAKILGADITDAVSITEPFLAEASKKIQVAQTAVQVFDNIAELVGWLDPVLTEDYAKVGTSIWDGTDLVF